MKKHLQRLSMRNLRLFGLALSNRQPTLPPRTASSSSKSMRQFFKTADERPLSYHLIVIPAKAGNSPPFPLLIPNLIGDPEKRVQGFPPYRAVARERLHPGATLLSVIARHKVPKQSHKSLRITIPIIERIKRPYTTSYRRKPVPSFDILGCFSLCSSSEGRKFPSPPHPQLDWGSRKTCSGFSSLCRSCVGRNPSL